MVEHPHDISDLHLAPVALEVDAQIAELSTLSDEELAVRVGVESDLPDWSVDVRRDALLRTVGHLIDLHGWLLSWDDRGVRLSHGNHSLVLGVPANFTRFVERPARDHPAPHRQGRESQDPYAQHATAHRLERSQP
jgi:hypothetical protein